MNRRILGVHDRRVAVGRELIAQRREGNVAAVLHRHVGAGAGDDDDGGYVALLERGVDVALQWDGLAAAHALVGGDHRAGVAIGDPAGQALGREAAEHHRMDGADACAGEHRRRRLGDHRHIDHHPVAAPDSPLLQQIGETAGLFVKLAVGDGATVAGLVGLENQRGAIAMLGEVPVEAIDRQVEPPVGDTIGCENRPRRTTSRRCGWGSDSRSAASPGRARIHPDRRRGSDEARRVRPGRCEP